MDEEMQKELEESYAKEDELNYSRDRKKKFRGGRRGSARKVSIV